MSGEKKKSTLVGAINWSAVDKALEDAAYPFTKVADKSSEQRRSHVFPGAVLLVGRGGDILYHKAFGCRSLIPTLTPISRETVFDVASLTKALVTTTLTMQFVDAGQLNVDRRLSHIFQTFGTHGKEQMTIRHLLSHTSGYPATAPYYKQIARANSAERTGMMTSRGAVQMIQNEIFRSKLDNLPGKVSKYSDIGFILLGGVLEVISGGKLLDRIAQTQIFSPLKLSSSGFIDLTRIRRRGLEPVTEMIAPTAECPWRGKILHGEVHDDNAWAMGGVAGHAGLFSDTEDIHLLATDLIECYHGRGSLVSRDTIREFWKVDTTVPGSTWALGWDTPSKVGSSSGKYFTPKAVGHMGYTGCSIWIDPERELDVILLTNRIHPSPDNQLIKDFRPKIHDLVMEAMSLGT